MNQSDRIPVKSVQVMVAGTQHSLPLADSHCLWFSDRTARLGTRIEPAPWDPECKNRLEKAAASGILRLVVGDYTEPGVSAKSKLRANSVLIDVDLITARASAISSAVGLPPIALHRSPKICTFSCPLLPAAITRSGFDIEGIADTLRWGHPLDGRTILSNVDIVPPGAMLALAVGSEPKVELSKEVRDPSFEPLDSRQIVQAQVAALLDAASRLPTSGAFLSLSGGLDSRTALVALLSHGRTIPCISMAGSAYTLDAVIARRFCETHGIAHEIVEFGEEYKRQLPDLAQRSAALTGGVASLSQTVDLYLYSKISGNSQIRISGHLGNQVGRGGVESIATSAPLESIFAEDLRAALRRRPMEPWFIGRMAKDGYASVLFTQEVHYWSIANYMLGSAQALQLSPYADVTLLGLSNLAISRDRRFNNPTTASIRRRDIRHRLFGPPLQRSFQRQTLVQYDPLCNAVPINWGWYARGGGINLSTEAVRTAADALISKLGRKAKFLKQPAARMSQVLGRPSALVAWPDLLRTTLRTLACDTLHSRKVAQSGLFDSKRLRTILDQHFNGEVDHYSTIYKALEIGLGITSAPQ